MFELLALAVLKMKRNGELSRYAGTIGVQKYKRMKVLWKPWQLLLNHVGYIVVVEFGSIISRIL